MDDLENTFDKYLAPLLEYFTGQPWVQGIVILLVTFVFASLISWIIFSIVKFLTSKTESYVDDRLLAVARVPVYYSLLITGFSAAIKQMPLSDKISDYLIFGFKSVGVLIWMIGLIRISKIILQQLAWGGGEKRIRLVQPQTLPLFDNLSKLIIVAVAVYIIFQIWGIDMTAWLASAGICWYRCWFCSKRYTCESIFGCVYLSGYAL